MDQANNKTSLLINSQLPEFVRRDHPKFIEFLEEYYKWMEEDGNVTYVTKNFTDIRDIDKLQEDYLIDQILGHNTESEMYHAVYKRGYYDQYLADFPQYSVTDLNKVLKNSLDFLRARGSEKSVRFLLRSLFGKESDVYYPQKNILRTSDGKWFIEKSLNVRDIRIDFRDNPVLINGVANARNVITSQVFGSSTLFLSELGVGDTITFEGNTDFEYVIVDIANNQTITVNAIPPIMDANGNSIYLLVQANTGAFERFVNTRINGLTSNAFAIIEDSNPYYDAGSYITELKVSNVLRDFINGEELLSIIEDNGIPKKLKANLYSGIVSHITITSNGSGYIEGSAVPVIPVSNGSGAQVYISKVSKAKLEGTIKSVDIVYTSGITPTAISYGYFESGAGYLANDQILFTGGGGSGAAANVFSVLADGSYHDIYYNIIGTTIQDLQDYYIANANGALAYSSLANIYVNTSNLVISSPSGANVQNVTLNFWTGNSNVYFETGDVICFFTDMANIANQTIITSNVTNNKLTVSPGVPGNLSSYSFQVVKKPNANNTIAESMIYWSYGPCGPIVSIKMLDAGSGYIELPTVSVLSNTQIRSLGILGRMEIIDPGTGYSVGDIITFDNPLGTYGLGGNAEISIVGANGEIQQIDFSATNGLPPGGFGYNSLNLPKANIQTATGNGANIVVVATLADDSQLLAKSNAVGSIEKLRIVSGGAGYDIAPTIDLSTQGDGTAQAYANIVTGVYSYPGRYLDESGQLSSYMFLQNRDYYQLYSYVVSISESLSKYRIPMNDLVHPAGTKLFGKHIEYDDTGAYRYESGAVNTFSQVGVNTSNIILTFDAAEYYNNILNDGNANIWYNSVDANLFANIANAPYYINGGISVTNNVANVIYDYSSANMTALRNSSGTYYYGGGMVFDGNNDKISISSNSALNVTNAITVIAWIDMIKASQSNTRTIIYNMNSSNTAGYHMYITANTLKVDINPGHSNNSLVISNTINSNVWTMTAFTYDGTTIRGYINGQLVNTSVGFASGTTDSNSSLFIGSSNNSNVMYGRIGLIQVYDRSIGNNEIIASFNRYSNRFYVPL